MTARTLTVWSGILVCAALLAATLHPSVGVAQDDEGLPTVDEDLGRRLRHPSATRPGEGWLRIGNSARRSPDPANDGEPTRRSYEAQPRWEYRWFDHPKPSYQYFSQPQTYVWRYDSYPGIGPHLEPYNNHYFFYYYPPPASYYYPPGYYWRYGTGGRYGW
jgi:hypothetical protein